jgi:hypothetical protein
MMSLRIARYNILWGFVGTLLSESQFEVLGDEAMRVFLRGGGVEYLVWSGGKLILRI